MDENATELRNRALSQCQCEGRRVQMIISVLGVLQLRHLWAVQVDLSSKQLDM